MLMSSFINNLRTATGGSGGSVTVNPTVYTAGIQKSKTLIKDQPFTLPSGAYLVEIFNNDLENSIEVNGSIILPQIKAVYESKVNHVVNKMDFVPQLDVVNDNGVEIIVFVIYPSTSPVDVGTL